MAQPEATELWVEINIDRAGDQLRVSALGSRGEQTVPRPLAADRGTASILRFGESVENAAKTMKPMGPEVIADATATAKALLAGEIEPIVARLQEAAKGEPLLVRLMIFDAEQGQIQSVPWEALSKPGEALGLWGTSPDFLPVRGVISNEPWQPREVLGAIRVLAIAPTETSGLDLLKSALAERIASGEIEWLDPLVGLAADAENVLNRLRREPTPNVLHFLGHGGFEDGVPALRFADAADDSENWMPVPIFAQEIKANLKSLRLVILEACEGAKPSSFTSAAEILAKAGTDAVVAYLWKVKADVARLGSMHLYRALTSSSGHAGNIAFALNEARRALLAHFDQSAEAVAPVLYLRGRQGVIFDFKHRAITSPRPLPAPQEPPVGVDPALFSALRGKFSLLLGDHLKASRAAMDTLRDKLRNGLAKASDPIPADLPLSTVAQRYALRHNATKLQEEFQKVFGSAGVPPIIAALARFLGPGVHTTLSWNPWLEASLAERQPNRTIYVIQPQDQGVTVKRRAASAEDWEDLDEPPKDFDEKNEIVLLRLYRGYTPDRLFTPPLLTEDDYQFSLHEVRDALPPDLANAILSSIRRPELPSLVVGMSIFIGHHRLLLNALHPRGLPRNSLAVLEAEDAEKKLWTSGSGLPGMKEGITVVEASTDALAAALNHLADAEGR